MASKVQRFTFQSAKRAGRSVNGNPSWDVTLVSERGGVHTYRTQSDAGWSYEVDNYKTGDVLDITFTRTDRIAFGKLVK